MRRVLGGLAAGTALLVACFPAAASASAATWTAQAVGLPSGATVGSLGGVSCTSASSCIAVGAYGTGATTRQDVLLAERWDGSTWTAETVPGPSDAFYADLNAVSCTSATSCVAVGSTYVDKSGDVETPVAESWNGSSWTAEDAVAPPSNGGARLTGVSCTSSTSCVAVGYWETSSSLISSPLAEYWNGSTWTLQTSFTPQGSTYAALSGVACITAVNCTAVGSYFSGTASGGAPLIEHWNGSSWAHRVAPVPAGSYAPELTAVSCGASDGCTAVGDYTVLPSDNGSLTAISDNDIPMAEHWNGHTWALQSVPEPAGTNQNTDLYGVSCASAGSCLAVGNWGYAALAEHYNGHAWNVQETVKPIGKKVFNAVSCVSPTTCTAVGTSHPSEGVLLPMAEQS